MSSLYVPKSPQFDRELLEGGYVVMFNHLKRSPLTQIIPDIDRTGFAQGLADWPLATLTPDTSRRFLVQLNACMEWAIVSRWVQLKESPFKGMASRAVGQRGFWNQRDLDPFNAKQRNAIIKHYKSHPKYSHYALYVKFCFSVACQPSSAIALEKENISAERSQITFTHAVVNAEGGRCRIKGLKTQQKRTIYTSRSVDGSSPFASFLIKLRFVEGGSQVCIM